MFRPLRSFICHANFIPYSVLLFMHENGPHGSKRCRLRLQAKTRHTGLNVFWTAFQSSILFTRKLLCYGNVFTSVRAYSGNVKSGNVVYTCVSSVVSMPILALSDALYCTTDFLSRKRKLWLILNMER